LLDQVDVKPCDQINKLLADPTSDATFTISNTTIKATKGDNRGFITVKLWEQEQQHMH